MDNAGKYISGTLLLLLAVAIYFVGPSIVTIPSTCSGWGMINPVCWLTSTLHYTFSFIFIALAIWTVLFAIMIFAFPAEKSGWVMLLYFALTFTIINLFIPDPIPWVDEIVGFLISGIAGIKVLGNSAPKQLQVF